MVLNSLLEPTLNFNIPSLQDALSLECCIYHPKLNHLGSTAQNSSSWKSRAVIVAHPYAILGGCKDDHVVGLIASTCLSEGFTVGTFNFRGAGGSEGCTSWQSKSEQKDYQSFVGFMAYYLHYLNTLLLPIDPLLDGPLKSDMDYSSHPQSLDISKLNHPHVIKPASAPRLKLLDGESYPRMRLILAGYSYGALVTMSIPARIQTILSPFQNPPVDSIYARIRQKAKDLASQQSHIIFLQFQNLSHSHESSLLFSSDYQGKRPKSKIGAPNEARLETRMHPQDGRVEKNFNEIRLTFRSRSSSSLEFKTSGYANPPDRQRSSFSTCNSLVDNITNLRVKRQPIEMVGDDISIAYLLVSPLQGILCDLLTLWTYRSWRERNVLTELDLKLQTNPTLAIYGDSDVFVSVKSLRNWAKKLQTCEGEETSQFQQSEIAGAGHFWHDSQSVERLRVEIRKFICEL
ncbi:putative alpha beta-hydrolase [Golovinomyces cichoracearum]|uniref:Putative alpha beta-hydrolase n=1 Tax=Golovinomyces cichoracearum TaxID=62708 RepID=A0A420J5T2_9PEZI|nr:putative alpha beta-hydrolase [Golovinomyces cichoracearum]